MDSPKTLFGGQSTSAHSVSNFTECDVESPELEPVDDASGPLTVQTQTETTTSDDFARFSNSSHTTIRDGYTHAGSSGDKTAG